MSKPIPEYLHRVCSEYVMPENYIKLERHQIENGAKKGNENYVQMCLADQVQNRNMPNYEN